MLQCSDRTLYTGITTDLQRRLREHNEAKAGARYTRVRRPVTLVYSEPAGSRSEAARREAQIKNCPAVKNCYWLHPFHRTTFKAGGGASRSVIHLQDLSVNHC